METGLAVGTCVGHPEYGAGTVLGHNEKREVIRIRFDTLGVKELPYPCPGMAIHPGGDGTDAGELLKLHFDRGPGSGSGCRWLLEFSSPKLFSLVQNVHTWAHSKAQTSGASVNLLALENRQMELRITGQGRDGRCRWCRTFRSGLRTAVRRGFGRKAFTLDGSCVFDSAPTPTAYFSVVKANS